MPGMPPKGTRFYKLEALGNDFVLIDARRSPLELDRRAIVELSDRRCGIGFDQLLVLRDPNNDEQVARVEIHNADGTSAEQCGNGMRAIAAWLEYLGRLKPRASLATPAGRVDLGLVSADTFSTDLPGPHALETTEISATPPPVPARATDWELVSTGNPHLVLLWPDEPGIDDLDRVAAAFAAREDWHNRVNIGLVHADTRQQAMLRVHERGAGPTMACGSGACAAAATLIRRGLCSSPVAIEQPGGRLVVHWQADSDRIVVQGPARVVFEGSIA